MWGHVFQDLWTFIHINPSWFFWHGAISRMTAIFNPFSEALGPPQIAEMCCLVWLWVYWPLWSVGSFHQDSFRLTGAVVAKHKTQSSWLNSTARWRHLELSWVLVIVVIVHVASYVQIWIFTLTSLAVLAVLAVLVRLVRLAVELDVVCRSFQASFFWKRWSPPWSVAVRVSGRFNPSCYRNNFCLRENQDCIWKCASFGSEFGLSRLAFHDACSNTSLYTSKCGLLFGTCWNGLCMLVFFRFGGLCEHSSM